MRAAACSRTRALVFLLSISHTSLLLCVCAVDGILLGLLKVGVDFARIGSLKKVAPPILRHMIHMGTSATGKNGQQESEKTALQDLKVSARSAVATAEAVDEVCSPKKNLENPFAFLV